MKLANVEANVEKVPDGDNWFTTFCNTFIAPYGMDNYGVRRKTLYDGAKISLFGLAHWNVYENEWEISRALWIFNQDPSVTFADLKENLLSYYENKKFWESVELGKKSTLFFIGGCFMGYLVYRWIDRYRAYAIQRMRNFFEN